MVAGGISWRAMPADFPDWARVYAFFRRWREHGLIAEFHDRVTLYSRDTIIRTCCQPTTRHPAASGDDFSSGTPEPGHFLTTSTSTAAWALDRSPGALRTVTAVFGTPSMSVAQFTATHAAHVQITDLRGLFPASVAALLQ
ncbi:transposase [Streptomyces europaeiscabiei]|nr:transposase [Streptomyces europaeiscabiei]MDX3585733.1 transposase [Streptomyces europaeiscabiei]MDX3635989.1 transposase [Streptomyces europaeiscabiei]MDX3654065.1 transposase [Streptomyces europaeiscabiei]